MGNRVILFLLFLIGIFFFISCSTQDNNSINKSNISKEGITFNNPEFIINNMNKIKNNTNSTEILTIEKESDLVIKEAIKEKTDLFNNFTINNSNLK